MQAAEHSFGLNGVRREASWARARSRLGMGEGIGMADSARPNRSESTRDFTETRGDKPVTQAETRIGPEVVGDWTGFVGG